ncbi:DUF6351 family protein [Massilia sp. PAMC28688]|uniref:DUF6351 family protein n=1 Tax=Massilia sp. PAMC28688 TaxID=2861283 RepID=UPI001E2C1DBC|nr:DUF6351 family protein [Massilia sp. PAMC28688]
MLSSAPQHVSGGDARIAVKAPATLADSLVFTLNGEQVSPPMARTADGVEGVVSGLVNGRNRLAVRAARFSAAITLTNHPVTGPIFSGPHQQPFICRTQESGLGQPLVDSLAGPGHPVFAQGGMELIGYSRLCSMATRIGYFYYTGSGFKPFDPLTGYGAPPPDMASTTVNGASAPFVVRVEVGTINRFLYTIATLAPFAAPGGVPQQFDRSAWNGKLVYWLRGGVGIGHQQGTAMWFNAGLSGSERRVLPAILAQGYALIASSGNETGVHYNLRLAEETALMTKERFIEVYGRPRWTIGLGGSGGAVQQYAFAQNRPGLLDGGIPIQSYPDMVTQVTPIADCPLLEQYFRDEVARDPASPWARWSRRSVIEGMHASDTELNELTGTPGTSECINGWHGAIPTVLNPLYKDPRYEAAAAAYGYPAAALAGVRWTHWNDLANIYGVDSDGFAPTTVDNVGVQYGLAALAQGAIDADQFLRLNACVGGWKAQREFLPWEAGGDPFDARNMHRSATCREPAGEVAPRHAGNLRAIRAAYASGHVFSGRRLGIPMIDLRPYLEPQLDMHNARQAFSIRARLREAGRGAHTNQVIWFTGGAASLPASVTDALALMDRYLSGGQAPADFVDRCVNAGGELIAAGPAVWDGILDRRPAGACTAAFPIYASPRMVAGESIRGDTFKCALKPVRTALADGSYPATVRFTGPQQDWLARIFPQGVCDYRLAGQGS